MAPPQEDMQQISQFLWDLELNDRSLPLGPVLMMRQDHKQVNAFDFKSVALAILVPQGSNTVSVDTLLEPRTLQRPYA